MWARLCILCGIGILLINYYAFWACLRYLRLLGWVLFKVKCKTAADENMTVVSAWYMKVLDAWLWEIAGLAGRELAWACHCAASVAYPVWGACENNCILCKSSTGLLLASTITHTICSLPCTRLPDGCPSTPSMESLLRMLHVYSQILHHTI